MGYTPLFIAAALLVGGCFAGSDNAPDPTDNVPPQIGAIDGVSDGGNASGMASISASASDNLAVTSFTLAIDGTQVASSANGSLSYDWDTTAEADGSYTLVFTARDAAGNTDTETYDVTVNNGGPGDTEDPVISSITGVSDGGTSSGTADIEATATDNVGVTSFTLEIDGSEVANESDGSLSYSWDTTAEADGNFTLLFTAMDAAGNSASESYSVTVDNGGGGGGAIVSGVVYAPNGTDPVSGALVYAIDDSGASSVSATGDPPDEDYYAYDYSEADGSFELMDVPTGMQTLKIMKGAFSQEFDYEVLEGDNELPAIQTTLPSSSGGGGMVEELVVVTGAFDHIQNVLAKIGLGDVDENGSLVLGTEQFTLVDGNGSLEDADYANFADYISDPANYEDARTIFINCGNGGELGILGDETIVADLKFWIEGGGRLYATDWSYDFVETLFPAAIDFFGGEDGLSETPELNSVAEAGDSMEEVDATILDADLLAWLMALGATNEDDTVTIEGWLIFWAAVEALAEDTTAWVEADVMVDGGESTRPVTATFNAGDGVVFFSSYHTEEVPTEDLTPQDRILQYFVFEVL
jgi:hypothetical protein